ncbi:MAG: M20/M25/M40 family metallo-hydrolase [Acidobacteria bacterium]|nr:M20/M25/M40 family metallo-hydrolase [Acidobacteriota bacterium]
MLGTFSFGQSVNAAAPAKSVYSAPAAEIDKIKDEGMNRSKVMDHIWYLTERIGPSLTNSPNMRRASEWTKKTFTDWGIQASLEPFGPWGRGWSLQGYTAAVIEPEYQPVLAYPSAWSPSTKGPITAEVVHIDAKDAKDLKKFEGKLSGKIVMMSGMRDLHEDFPRIYSRFNDEQLVKLIESGAVPRPPSGGLPDVNNLTPEQRRMFETMAKTIVINGLIGKERPAALIENSMRGSQGAVMVHSVQPMPAPNPEVAKTLAGLGGPWAKGAEPHLFPTLTMAGEDYNRLARQLANGVKLKMTVDIRATYHDENMLADNVIAEIPGSDPKLKDEVVMLGAHLDSWHASKGATDNAAGSGVVMEAMRILAATGLKPRRTIRAALWSGEEQGLHGSKAYVAKHFAELPRATKEIPKPQPIKAADYDKLSAYFNLDNGGGKIRGLYLMGNAEVKPIFDEWLKPFHDVGARTTTLLTRGSTDHVSYDNVGLPGFGFIQDPLNYDLDFGPRSHHTNLDNYDRIIPDDMKQAATIMAAFVYQTAMMDEKLPRKPLAKPITAPVAGLFDDEHDVHGCGITPFDSLPSSRRSWLADRRFKSIEELFLTAGE